MKKQLRIYPRGISKLFPLTFLLLIFTVFQSIAQSRQISGTVTSSADKSAIPGANIIIKGTTTGTVSDADGKFSITVPDNNAVVVISYLGFATEEITVGNQTSIALALTPDLKTLGEVVVIGYGTQQRKDLSGSISSVSAAQIEKTPVTTLDQALQGRSPGVQVTSNDGAPGGGVSIRIRGIGSLGSNDPLYVVDGYPLSGGIASLNPNDIATMDILKDASATAIYGSRAANGVVIITTKRGKKDGLELTFDAYASVQQKPKKYDMANAQQFATLAAQVADAEGYEVLPEWRNPSSLRTIDWQDELYQTGLRQNYNIGLRGGSEKVKASFSVGYIKHKGVIMLSDYQRYNANLGLDYTPKKWLKISTDVKYARQDDQIRLGSGINGVGLLTKNIPTMTGNPLTNQVKDANGNYGYYTKGYKGIAGSTNLVADIETQDRQNLNNNLLTTGSAEVTLFKGLTVKSLVGINYRDYSGYYFTPTNNRTEFTTLPFYSQSANNNSEWLWENTVAYSRTFGVHSIDFVAGVSAQENTYRTLNVQGSGQISDVLRSVGSIDTPIPTGYQETWSLASQFGRLTYKLLDRYIITGTVRRDGSSRFGPGHKYGIFPSGSIAWKIKEENFLKDLNILSDLKIRASYGSTGNQNIAPFGYVGLYNNGTSIADNRGYVFGKDKKYYNGLALTALPNPDLKWETTVQSDFGVDASFLQNRITFSADYYIKESRDFLLEVPIPSQTGFSSAKKNVGSIRNSGLELSLEYRDKVGDLGYGIGANVTTVKNEILSFTEGLTSVGNFSNLGMPDYGGNTWTQFSRSQVGGNVGAFYGFKTDGLFTSQEELNALNAAAVAKYGAGSSYQSSGTALGDRKFVDVNKDGRITDDDRVIIGSPIPKWFGGLNIDASYKQFDFSMFWYAQVGNKILNYAKRNLQSIATNGGVGVQNFSTDYYENRWTPENPNGKYPRAVREDKAGNTRVSDAYIEDGSFMRLKTMQIGYTLPASLLGKINVNKVRVYVSGQNLLTLTKYTGLDPEIGEATDPNGNRSVTYSGLDLGNYPNSRFFTVGINVGL